MTERLSLIHSFIILEFPGKGKDMKKSLQRNKEAGRILALVMGESCQEKQNISNPFFNLFVYSIL